MEGKEGVNTGSNQAPITVKVPHHHTSMSIFPFDPQKHSQVGIVKYIFQVRKLRLREGEFDELLRITA